MIKTLFLAADPSPLYGAARIFDIGGVFDVYNSSESPEEADIRALYSDWKVVGDSLREAAGNVR